VSACLYVLLFAHRTSRSTRRSGSESGAEKKDGGHRERSRVLAALADQALARVEWLSVKDLQANAVDALVTSETLRDRGNDRVIFRHDVLREWAIANALLADVALLDRLPLSRPAPSDLGRGVELAARLAIERDADAELWHQFRISTSKEGVNGSWRRAVLLALVRSEVASAVLTKASSYLLADGGAMLCEVVRTVLAVESVPATKYFAAAGLDPHQYAIRNVSQLRAAGQAESDPLHRFGITAETAIISMPIRRQQHPRTAQTTPY
jgi:hypothetical protein